MSTYFSKIIKAGDRLREFNFKLSSVYDSSKYTVDVPDDKGERVVFSMSKESEQDWRISAQPVPQWVHEAEPSLADAIQLHRESEGMKKR